MKSKKHQQEILTLLEYKAAQDLINTQVIYIDKTDIAILLRQRQEQTLSDQLCQSCPMCQGTGKIKKIQTIVFEIIQKILEKTTNCQKITQITISASAMIIQYLNDNQVLNQLQKQIDLPTPPSILLQTKAAYSHEQYVINFE